MMFSIESKNNADTLADATSALRASIASATHTIHDGLTPAYILGNIVAATRELGEVLDELSQWHSHNASHAQDQQGTSTTGGIQALKTAAILAQTAITLDQANDQIMEALSLTNQTIWLLPQRELL